MWKEKLGRFSINKFFDNRNLVLHPMGLGVKNMAFSQKIYVHFFKPLFFKAPLIAEICQIPIHPSLIQPKIRELSEAISTKLIREETTGVRFAMKGTFEYKEEVILQIRFICVQKTTLYTLITNI